MPRLVEDAGGELSAGYVHKHLRWLNQTAGTAELGGRAVCWEIGRDEVVVTHPAGAGDRPLQYVVRVVTTTLPSDGLRRWWSCPGCAARVDGLYLPPGADSLRCRRCCRLTYRSQQSAGPVASRKERPALWSERSYKRWEYCAAAGRLVLVTSRRTRRRL